MARRLWIGKVKAGMQRRGTVGIFGRKARTMGVSTATLARRWAGKAGVWGRRARLALTFGKLRGHVTAAGRRRGARKAARTRARRRG